MQLPNARFMINVFIREKDSHNEWKRAGETSDGSVEAQRKSITQFYAAGVESPADLLVRVRLFLSELRQNCSGQRVVVVCHRHVIKAFEVILKNCRPVEYCNVWTGDVPNCLIQWYSRRDREGNVRSRFCRRVSFAMKEVADLTATHTEVETAEEELQISAMGHMLSSQDLCRAASTYRQSLNNEDLQALCSKEDMDKTPPAKKARTASLGDGRTDGECIQHSL